MKTNDLYILLLIVLVFSIFITLKSIFRYHKKKLINQLNKQQLNLLEILEEEGYKLKDCNKIIEKKAETNGKVYYHVYEVPLIVKKNNKKYIVHIKKKKETIRLSAKKDRELFLNLCILYKVNGVIIVDPDGKRFKYLIF